MPPLASRIGLLTDIFLGAAFADAQLLDQERGYVRSVVMDLLATKFMPPELEERIAKFNPASFDLSAAAADFVREPPMSRRRLLELVAYVTLSDGAQSPEEDAYLRKLGHALGLEPKEYADLCREKLHLRESFTDLARVSLPPSALKAH